MYLGNFVSKVLAGTITERHYLKIIRILRFDNRENARIVAVGEATPEDGERVAAERIFYNKNACHAATFGHS